MNQDLLVVDNLARHYVVGQGWFKAKGVVKALDGVSFSLAPSRTLAIVGESGCGKSTLARQLTLIERPTSGSISLSGVGAAGADRQQLRSLRQQVQMVFQNPFASLNPRKSIAATLDEPLRINTALDAQERREKVDAVVGRVGLRPEHLRRYPHMFSGGQRQRIAIARAMMLSPRLVVADEPTSALDVSVQAQILNLFMDLQQEMGVAYVFISHNLGVVEHVAHDVAVMYLGRIVEQGTKAQVFGASAHPYTRALLSATPTLRPAERRQRIMLRGELPSPLNPPSGCHFHKRCPLAQARCADEAPVLRPVDGRQVACHLA